MASFLAIYFSLVLKFGDFFPSQIHLSFYTISLPIIIGIQAITFYIFGLHRGLWKFTSLNDYIKILKISSISLSSSFILLFLINRLEFIPRSIFIIQWLLLVFFLSLGRVLIRLSSSSKPLIRKKLENSRERVLIVGAGQGGERLLRDIQNTPSLELDVIGFIEDDPNKQSKQIHGVPIIGTTLNIARIIKTKKINKIFIAIPTATSKTISRIIEQVDDSSIKIKTLPKMSDLLYGKVDFSQLRNINSEDLLGREEINWEDQELFNSLNDKVILITGAGGSIGSEICHQLSFHDPKLLVFYELTEFNLYKLEADIKKVFPEIKFISILGDIKDENKLNLVMETYKPDYVYHAAAYKHVPMVEKNPSEGIKTNIKGSKIVAQTAIKNKVKRFVLISTDKAVNPTNLMGASKRIAEQVIQNFSEGDHDTKFIIVRFGNVLGSSGSVIPLFKKQIEEGGPVTVTHKDIERFFMSISEAARLVIQASLLGFGKEIFVLEMGTPVKILKLAENLIRLSGLTPNKDIKIEFTGLRPGEKLYEELLTDKEKTLPTPHPKIRVAQARKAHDNFCILMDELLNFKETNDCDYYRVMFKKLVPEYTPKNIPENQHIIIH